MANTSLVSEKEDLGGSEFHTTHDSCISLPGESPGGSSNPRTPSASSSSSVYYAPRIQSMTENRRQFSSELEFEIESSKVHWSELDPTFHTEHSGDSNQKHFEVLKPKQDAYREKILKMYPERFFGFEDFFRDMNNLKLGKKIGEGAQAEIYEAGKKYVVKVFKAGYPSKIFKSSGLLEC